MALKVKNIQVCSCRYYVLTARNAHAWIKSHFGVSRHPTRPYHSARQRIPLVISTISRTKRSTSQSTRKLRFRRYLEKFHTLVYIIHGLRSASAAESTLPAAHWLAVEGVQPAIPQNPSPADLRSLATSSRSSGRVAATAPEGADIKPLVAHALSKELQLYFDRLTSAAVDPTEAVRIAALESFRGDTGLQGLVAYLIQWIAERVRLEVVIV